uniref:Uncharacterized protein n=1 Tax=Panagrolaimus davidi TaxID=227884 RepID=A0A914PDP2_9BILA
MKSLGQTLPVQSSSTELSRMWTNDFNQRYRSSQPSTASSTLSSQWLKQYQPSQHSLSQSSTGSTISTTQRELESIWNNQTHSQNLSVLKHKMPSFDLEFSIFYSLKDYNFSGGETTTNMWSREYLDSFDTDPFFEAKQTGTQWANQYLESESLRQNELHPQQQNQTSQEMFENFQTEWDSLANAEFGENYFGGNTDIGYQFQQVYYQLLKKTYLNIEYL